MECILAFFDLLGMYRILLLYMKRNTALILTPLPLAMVFASYSFLLGRSCRRNLSAVFLLWGAVSGIALFLRRSTRRKQGTAGPC